jgi:hypothetical protein
MWLGKEAEGEGMALDLGLRDGSFNYPKDQKGLTRGTRIEAVIKPYTISLFQGRLK